GAWWSGRLVGGMVGGLLAALLLGAAPTYLEASRQGLTEVPSLVPCIWAVGCALRWRRGGGAGWLYGAVALGTCGVLIKPMALAVAGPVGLLMLLRPGLRWTHLAISAALVVGISAALVLIMGPTDMYQQVVQYR